MPNNTRTVLGIDPGYERLGIAVLSGNSNSQSVLHSDCLRTKATLPFSERLRILGEAVEALLEQYTPDALALETLFFSTNKTTAMGVAEVRGMLRYLAAKRGITLFEYGPGEIKVAVTGDGRSDKKQIMALLPRLLSLPKTAVLDDEFDAIAVALTCLVSERG